VIIFRIMQSWRLISRRNLLAAAGFSLTLTSRICAIDSQVKFKARTIDGQDFSTESVQGKVVLVEFWATWCPYCKRDAPAVDAIQEEFRDQRLVVLAVDIAESKKTVAKYLAESPRNCKVVLMTDTNLAALYSPKTFPHYALIDPTGHEVGEQKGAGGERSLRHLLRKAGLGADDSGDPRELQSSPRRA